jgi:hypothetical protein
MEVVKGTIKILENKIILKTNNTTETYIKKFSITNKNWIEFKGDIYEIESGLEEDYEFDN